MTRQGVNKQYGAQLANGYDLGLLGSALVERGFQQIMIQEESKTTRGNSFTLGENHRSMQAWYKRITFGNDPGNQAAIVVNALIPSELMVFGEYHIPDGYTFTESGVPTKRIIDQESAHKQIDENMIGELEGILNIGNQLPHK